MPYEVRGASDAIGYVLAQLQPFRKLRRSDPGDARQGRNSARRHGRRSVRTMDDFPCREGGGEKPMPKSNIGTPRHEQHQGTSLDRLGRYCAGLLLAMFPWRANTQSEFLRGDRMPYDAFDKLAKTDLDVPGGVIHVGFAPGDIALPKQKILDWVRTSAQGGLDLLRPVSRQRVRLLLVPVDGPRVRGGTDVGLSRRRDSCVVGARFQRGRSQARLGHGA